jgi:hypothetical protein
MSLAQRVMLVLVMVTIVVAGTYAFLPLPGQLFQGEHATCGGGHWSYGAVIVKVFPDSVVSGPPPTDPSVQAEVKAFEDQCQGVADTRLEAIAAVIIGALIAGALGYAILDPDAGRAP